MISRHALPRSRELHVRDEVAGDQNDSRPGPIAPCAEGIARSDTAVVEVGTAAKRLVSLDAFRGLTIALMLLVNNVALDQATPKTLTHAPWNGGVRAADLVFPWFLFCVGVAIPFSVRSMQRQETSWPKMALRMLGRTAILFLLGCLVTSAEEHRVIFSLGVLQLIALAYLVGGLLYPLGGKTRLAVSALLLAGYGVALKHFPVPGIGTGVFEEQTNVVKHINQTYLSQFNLSGLPSVIPTAALVLIGTLIGDVALKREQSRWWKFGIFVGFGFLLVLLAIAWNVTLPYNKPVWTPSYVLLTGGLGSIILGGLYALLDLTGWQKLAFPLVVFGSNALVAYAAPVLLKTLVLQNLYTRTDAGILNWQTALLHLAKTDLGALTGGWVYTVGYVAVCWAVLLVLHQKRWLLRA